MGVSSEGGGSIDPDDDDDSSRGYVQHGKDLEPSPRRSHGYVNLKEKQFRILHI